MTEKERNLLYGVVSLILPENILDQFDIVKLEDEDIARNDGTYQQAERLRIGELCSGMGACLYGETYSSSYPLLSAFNRKRLRMARVASAGVSGVF